MNTNSFKNITHVFHDWDGVYTHHEDFDAFWKTAARVAVEAGVMDCETKAAKVILEKWHEARKTENPYETAFELLHVEYDVCFDFCIKRHHEILFQDFGYTFTAMEGIPDLMDKLKHLNHFVLTHANRFWVNSWIPKVGVYVYFEEIVCSIEQGLGRKNKDLHLFSGLENKWGVNPENCLLIDDSLPNLLKAKEAGWKTSWIKPISLAHPGVVDSTEINPEYVDASYLTINDCLKSLIKLTS